MACLNCSISLEIFKILRLFSISMPLGMLRSAGARTSFFAFETISYHRTIIQHKMFNRGPRTSQPQNLEYHLSSKDGKGCGVAKRGFEKAFCQSSCPAEVRSEFFSVFLCQRCREIWREIFRVTRFPGFGCLKRKFHQSFTPKMA